MAPLPTGAERNPRAPAAFPDSAGAGYDAYPDCIAPFPAFPRRLYGNLPNGT